MARRTQYTVFPPHAHTSSPCGWRVALCTLRGQQLLEISSTPSDYVRNLAMLLYGSLAHPVGTWADALARVVRPADAMYHCELAFTLPCTWTGKGGSCAAPFGHVAGRVRPYHVVVVDCVIRGDGLAGVGAKELPRQAHTLGWMYHRIDVSAAERHRALLYSLSFVGSRYRDFALDLSYAWRLPSPAQGRLQLWYGSLIGSFGPGLYTYPEAEARARRLHEECDASPDEDPFAREARLTAVLLRELGTLMPALAAGSVRRHVAELARRLADHEARSRARGDDAPYASPATPEMQDQVHTFTCIELCMNTLMFAGVLTRTGGCPTNRTVPSLHPCLLAEGRIRGGADSTLLSSEHLKGQHLLSTGSHVYAPFQEEDDDEDAAAAVGAGPRSLDLQVVA